MKPRIFISAVTKELKTARQLVANTLLALGFEPVWQDIFETHSGDIRPMLREKLDSCSAVLQIVGDAYGAEPPAPDEQFGRVSYTQYEALYARSRGNKVYYLVAEANLPRDCPAEQLDQPREDSDSTRTDSAERKKLQQAYRANIQSTEHIFYAVQTESETELTVRRLKSDLEKLRRWFQNWMLAVSVALMLLVFVSSGGFWWLRRGQQQQAANPARVREQLERTIAQTYDNALHKASKLTEWRKQADAEELAKAQHDRNLARVDEFQQAIVTVIHSGKASPEYLEMARILIVQGAEEAVAYIASRKQDLLAKSRASKADNRRTSLLPILEQARIQVLLGRYAAARQTCDELLAEDPEWGEALYEQFWSVAELGHRAFVYQSLHDTMQFFAQSHRIAETLNSLPIPHPETQRILLLSHDTNGDLHRRYDNLTARTHYEAVIKICQRLADLNPSDIQAQRDLALSHNKIVNLASGCGAHRLALTHQEESHKILQRLALSDPHDAETLRDLAESCSRLASFAMLLDDFDVARGPLAEGISIIDQMIAAGQLEQSLQQEKAVLERELVHCNRCLIAIGDWEGLVSQPAEELPLLLAMRLERLAEKGERAEVQQATEMLLSLEPKTSENYFNAAHGFALCLKLVSGSSARGPFPPNGGVPEGTEEERRLRKEYRVHAIAAIKNAIGAGWSGFKWLRCLPGFSALHGDPEFEALFPKPAAEEKPAK